MDVSKKTRKAEIGNSADSVRNGSMNTDAVKVTAKNKERFNRAFINIKAYLERYLKNNPDYKGESSPEENYLEFFSILKIKASNEKKIKMWQNFMQRKNLYDNRDSALSYDKEQWLKEVFIDYTKKKYSRRIITDAQLIAEFENTSWFRFVKSVKWYKSVLHEVLKDNGLNIPL